MTKFHSFSTLIKRCLSQNEAFVDFSATSMCCSWFALEILYLGLGLGMRSVTWNRFPIKKISADWFLLVDLPIWAVAWCASLNHRKNMKAEPSRVIPFKFTANLVLKDVHFVDLSSRRVHLWRIVLTMEAQARGITAFELTAQMSKIKVLLSMFSFRASKQWQKWDSNPRLQGRLRPERSALDHSAILPDCSLLNVANTASKQRKSSAISRFYIKISAVNWVQLQGYDWTQQTLVRYWSAIDSFEFIEFFLDSITSKHLQVCIMFSSKRPNLCC